MMDPFHNWNRDEGTCHGQSSHYPYKQMTHKIDKAFAQEGM